MANWAIRQMVKKQVEDNESRHTGKCIYVYVCVGVCVCVCALAPLQIERAQADLTRRDFPPREPGRWKLAMFRKVPLRVVAWWPHVPYSTLPGLHKAGQLYVVGDMGSEVLAFPLL
jgi:hypothetical protein